jgi:hypothetical protein
MIERGPATEDEMISAFLQAEIDSPRWGPCVKAKLTHLGSGRLLIDSPNLKDAAENLRRKQVLDCYRCYQPRKDIFTGFPLDVTWYRAELQAQDFQTMQYMAHRYWSELSNGTRLVSVGARNFPGYACDRRFLHIGAIIHDIRDGKRFAPLIAAQHHGGHLVLIEGHCRATAYTVEGYAGLVEAFVSSSPSMNEWEFY